jgi:hypothetical protein
MKDDTNAVMGSQKLFDFDFCDDEEAEALSQEDFVAQCDDTFLVDLVSAAYTNAEAKAGTYLTNRGRVTEDEFKSVIDRICFVDRKMEAEIDFLAEEEKRLKARRAALENAKERVRGYLQHLLTTNDCGKIKTPLNTAYFSNRQAALYEGEGFNLENVPEEFVRTVIEHKLDKAKIKNLIETGLLAAEDLEQYGLSYERRKSLVIR